MLRYWVWCFPKELWLVQEIEKEICAKIPWVLGTSNAGSSVIMMWSWETALLLIQWQGPCRLKFLRSLLLPIGLSLIFLLEINMFDTCSVLTKVNIRHYLSMEKCLFITTARIILSCLICMNHPSVNSLFWRQKKKTPFGVHGSGWNVPFLLLWS